MHGYRIVWRLGWGAVALAGTGLAALLWPLSSLLLTWLFGSVIAAGAASCWFSTQGRPDEEPKVARVEAGWALVGALFLSGTGGWMQVSAGGALALAALSVLTAPPLVALVASRWRQPQQVSGSTFDQVVARGGSIADACRTFTTVELCLAWNQTFALYEATADCTERLRILTVREAFLDELERRDPAGLEAWLCSRRPAHEAPTMFFAAAPPPDLSA